MSPDAIRLGICGPTGDTTTSPARTLARRSGASSIQRKVAPDLTRCSIWLVADRVYSSHARKVAGSRSAAWATAQKIGTMISAQWPLVRRAGNEIVLISGIPPRERHQTVRLFEGSVPARAH